MFKHKKLAAVQAPCSNSFREGKEEDLQQLIIIGNNPRLKRTVVKDTCEDEEEEAEYQSAERESEKELIDEEDEVQGAPGVGTVFKDLIGQVNKIHEVLSVGSPEKALSNNISPKKGLRSANKENVASRSFQGSPSKTGVSPGNQGTFQDPNNLLYMMYNMILELKSQTAYLIERQSDLEYLVTQDLKPTLEDGLSKVRQDLRKISSANNKITHRPEQVPHKRRAAMTTKLRVRFTNENKEKFLKSEMNPSLQVPEVSMGP